MRFYTKQHQYYCGIDLHSKWMYVCVVDAAGNTVFHRNIPARPEPFLEAIQRFRGDLAVGVECMYCWYWLADLCAEEGIEFVLGHALYMKAIHGGKAKNDKIDSHKLALMLKGGMFPLSYVYPRGMRAVRDLMRRRMFFVHRRSELLAHVQMTFQQHNFPEPGRELAYQAKRDALVLPFNDEATRIAVEADMLMIQQLSTLIRKLEYQIQKHSLQCSNNEMTLRLLQTLPGVGDILSATILYEVHDIARFPTVQHFASYARLVKPDKISAGKKTGEGGAKIGNAHLKWAFSEAAAISTRDERMKRYAERLQKRHSKSKAMTIIAHKLGRAAYFMLQQKKPFDENRFFSSLLH